MSYPIWSEVGIKQPGLDSGQMFRIDRFAETHTPRGNRSLNLTLPANLGVTVGNHGIMPDKRMISGPQDYKGL